MEEPGRHCLNVNSPQHVNPWLCIDTRSARCGAGNLPIRGDARLGEGLRADDRETVSTTSSYISIAFQLHFNCISTMNRGTRRVDKYDITQQEFVSDYTLIASRMYSGITSYCRVFCSASQHASVAQRMHTRCTTRAHFRAVTGHISAPTCISWPAVSRASALSTAGAGAVTQKRDLNGACGRTQKTRARTLSEKSWFVGPRFRPGPRRSAGSLRGPGAARRRRLAPPGAPPCRLPAPERPPAG